MQAVCLLTSRHLERAIAGTGGETLSAPVPSLVIFDVDLLEAESYKPLDDLKENPMLAGVPVFFAVSERTEETDEACYAKGAVVVVHKQLSTAELLRAENTAYQFENTRLYEQELQTQAAELKNAKEIYRLNTQLKMRNDLLYKVFGRYFSEDIVDVILEDAAAVSLGGEKRHATILVADLRGFTAIGERLDPEELSTLLNFYFSKMVDVITAHHGTVIEFLGDGLLAVFGALLHDTSAQAQDALACAITMQNAMEEVNAFCRKKGFPHLNMGIGVHTGEVFVGNIGSEKLMRYNVVGSAVNICSRIESCTVGGQILASREALLSTDCEVSYAPMGEIMVKGASHAIAVFEITGIGGEEPCTLHKSFEEDDLSDISEKVMVGLFPMDEKITGPGRIMARVQAISEQRIKVKLPSDSDVMPILYDNVVLVASGEKNEENAAGKGWYAKVIERFPESMVLHFTQMDDAAKEFVDTWLGKDKG